MSFSVRPTEINFTFYVREKLKRYERARKQNKTGGKKRELYLINHFSVCFSLESAKRYERADAKRRIYFGWPDGEREVQEVLSFRFAVNQLLFVSWQI